MSSARQAIRISVLSVLSLSLVASAVRAQATQPAKPSTTAPAAAQKPYEPEVGQAGKDVVWVPTPQALVEKMLDMAKVTPKDFVIDLGSGDGRTVITAAKRGATAKGIEYNPDMVELSKRNAEKEGVSAKATFEKADLFQSDFSKAQVVTMFLLPTINMKLRPTILNLKPGTRIVSNSFTMEDWQADETATVDKDCTSWCTAYLWIVPAKVEGTWTMPAGRADAEAAVSDGDGHAGIDADPGRQADRRRDLVQGRQRRLQGQGRGQHDVGRGVGREQRQLDGDPSGAAASAGEVEVVVGRTHAARVRLPSILRSSARYPCRAPARSV